MISPIAIATDGYLQCPLSIATNGYLVCMPGGGPAAKKPHIKIPLDSYKVSAQELQLLQREDEELITIVQILGEYFL